jgi:hypothetical protein
VNRETQELSSEPSPKKGFDSFWLLFPWLAVGSLFLAEGIGLRTWIFERLPFDLADTAQTNIGWGILLLTFGSSARWVYLRLNTPGREIFPFWVKTFVFAGLLTIAHACLAAGVLFAGCMIVMWSR